MNWHPFFKSNEQPSLHRCHLIAMCALVLVLLVGCATPPTRAPGQRAPSIDSSAPAASFTSPIASFSPVAWQQIPGWQEDDLSAAWSRRKALPMGNDSAHWWIFGVPILRPQETGQRGAGGDENEESERGCRSSLHQVSDRSRRSFTVRQSGIRLVSNR